MAVDKVTAPPEALTALSTEVPPYDNNTNPPVDYCTISATSQEENGGTKITIANTTVDAENPNLDKTAAVNSPQQRKLANFGSIELDYTGRYNSDG